MTRRCGRTGRGLFLPDLLRSQEPESAGKPDALQTLRVERNGSAHREASGVRGFTPALRARFMGRRPGVYAEPTPYGWRICGTDPFWVEEV